MSRRAFVPALFAAAAALTALQVAHAAGRELSHPGPATALVVLYLALRTVVTAAFAIFTFGRGEPRRRAREPIAFAACGLAMATAVAFTPPDSTAPVSFVLAGDLLAVLSCGWLLWAVLRLGRCFGMLPEARGLVVAGPYRVVRHPVYLGEICAFTGLALASPGVVNAVVLIVLVAAQGVRVALEEHALTEAFGDDYRRYAARVPRIVPTRTSLQAAVGRGRA